MLGRQVRSSKPTSQKVYRVAATMAEKKFRNFQDLTPPPYLYFANLSDLPIISQWGTSEFSFTSLNLCGLI